MDLRGTANSKSGLLINSTLNGPKGKFTIPNPPGTYQYFVCVTATCYHDGMIV